MTMTRRAFRCAGRSSRRVTKSPRRGTALRRSRSLRPCDIVVMDIVMPVKGGLETLIELRGGRPRIGVILMSGTAQTAAGPFQHLAERLGVEHVFAKPVPLDRLLAAVAELTSHLSRTLWGAPRAASLRSNSLR